VGFYRDVIDGTVNNNSVSRVENCILEDRRVTVDEIAAELSLHVSSVEKISR